MAKQKEFYKYISSSSTPSVSLKEYIESPATAFLKYANDAKDAAFMCNNKFSKKSNGEYRKDSLDSIHIINAGLLSSIMGNYETFQKYLFAQMFEYSIYLNKFNVSTFVKMLNHESNEMDIELIKMAAYRDNPVGIGLMLAYNLKGWQTPSKVINYFHSFCLKDARGKRPPIYNDEDKKDLAILWQMRHSIVHTAGTITIPDSQKILDLNTFGEKEILLGPEFIPAVARKMHKLTNRATSTMGDAFILNLKHNLGHDVIERIKALFKVDSSNKGWLR